MSLILCCKFAFKKYTHRKHWKIYIPNNLQWQCILMKLKVNVTNEMKEVSNLEITGGEYCMQHQKTSRSRLACAIVIDVPREFNGLILLPNKS